MQMSYEHFNLKSLNMNIYINLCKNKMFSPPVAYGALKHGGILLQIVFKCFQILLFVSSSTFLRLYKFLFEIGIIFIL